MIRLIFLLAVIAIAVLIVRKILETGKTTSDEKPPARKPLTDMVRCEHCGVHLPLSEAVQDGDHYYCSREHKELAAKD